MQSEAKLLNILILKWLNLQGWVELRDIQEKAIRPILSAKKDVIISAATASGKTEAAFLPAISKILDDKLPGIRIIYISPLKALINDQFKRLEMIAHTLKINVTPWHGDVSQGKKNKVFNLPEGIILITPESFESLLINHNNWCKENLKNLSYFIIDEFHAFIGTERGYQLLSQMHRIDILTKRNIPRIALSATLSNIQSVKKWLRPNSLSEITVIQGNSSSHGIKLQIRGYTARDEDIVSKFGLTNQNLIADIFKQMRGSTNLIFANSRAYTEYVAARLDALSKKFNVPNEFFPHHGSLAKELREALENRLKESKLPTTAICTQTLELGIDIGDVTSVAQINAPQSVASLRQRLGRSGRRNKESILRLYIIEKDKDCKENIQLSDTLCNETFVSTAMIELVLNRWVEPPTNDELALSTLVQQILSVIAQYGSVQALNLWKLLCKTGPFHMVSQKLFAQVLKELGEKDLITQLTDGSLTLGLTGEKTVSLYNFYSSFKNQEEYTIDHKGTKIGTIPLNQPLTIGKNFLFAGKGWEVVFVNPQNRIISVREYNNKTEPIGLDGGSELIHDGVREKMFELYKGNIIPKYLNEEAQNNFIRGRKKFRELNLKKNPIYQDIEGLYIFPWKGDKIMHTIEQILIFNSQMATKAGSYIFVPSVNVIQFREKLEQVLKDPITQPEILASVVKNLYYEKFDNFLNENLLRYSYGYRNFDLKGAYTYLKELQSFLQINAEAFSVTNE
ncbi:MAG: DEAD/DEAH box helicase [Succinivibrionaceae bacterium]|nr:DEAD/DEAH box helicase [Succinivibrionaceae bacterium]